MTSRRYGQYCGLARALEMVGSRWGLLIIRDLLVGPRRFSDLEEGLPQISTSVLSSRLKELEEAGIVRRSVVPRPGTGFQYELTEYGSDLEDAVAALGRWGARRLGEPAEGEVVTPDSMVMALRSTFRPGNAGRFRGSFELRVGPVVVHAEVHEGRVVAGPGPAEDPDMVLEAGPGIRALMAGQLTPEEALEKGIVRIDGPRELLDRFATLFRIGPSPAQPV